MQILIIEDDSDLAANLYDYLEAKGHIPDSAGDGVTGLHLAITNDYDVIVMDINMPGMNGLTACRKLREEAGKQTPVLMLTARDTLDDKLAGFDSGADDYLVKPFALQELLARLTALSKRGKTENNLETIEVSDLSYNPRTLEVIRNGQTLTLTPTGLKILELLMRNSPNVVSRQLILSTVWPDTLPDSDALRAHIHTLRSAVDKPFGAPLIHTIHGIGFKLAALEN
ncbi:response regulator transcription factor [Pseudomonadota bacterium]